MYYSRSLFESPSVWHRSDDTTERVPRDHLSLRVKERQCVSATDSASLYVGTRSTPNVQHDFCNVVDDCRFFFSADSILQGEENVASSTMYTYKVRHAILPSINKWGNSNHHAEWRTTTNDTHERGDDDAIWQFEVHRGKKRTTDKNCPLLR